MKTSSRGPLGYCHASGTAIQPSDTHFRCADCGELFLEQYRFEDKPVCQSCAFKSGMAQQLEQERAEQQRQREAEEKKTREADERRQAEQQKQKLGIGDSDWADIPAGEFLMGSPESEQKRSTNERQHRVKVQAFQMLKTPVTFAMFDSFCEATVRSKPKDEGWGRADRPVINVSYWDAVDYCEWLSEQTGDQIRLPTEAEWEYACRASATTAYWYGDEPDHGRMHCSKEGLGDAKQTKPVGLYEANSWGFKDMHGNIFEWCASELDNSYQDLEQRSAMTDRTNENCRVLRGGSWWDTPVRARSASRLGLKPDYGPRYGGFRIARIQL
ncbi:MAG: SUMF1/EgtB/PvdO family nonheme iron enzyme [Candidatus Thiodiazotropha endolucinida]|nr:SUMF1/EgtB/PvdO family nonheme iron enzyme [Candidatus Thiodiazotropha taylori]MCW4311975.1 SUMF1/EgtB/PvdO family nonheme iron enzyme [Candidatus Thiodiazotropha taylori]